MISIGDSLDGKYDVVSRLGGGGYGDVFLADDTGIPGRQVALKVLSRNSLGNVDDLIWEMQTLSRLNHPGVVVFHHHFNHGNSLVLVMEFCAGGSLLRRLYNAGCIGLDETFRWAMILCDTLGFVHQHGIVHHDIKPANILFTRDGAIKIGDFGVANRNIGTRLYMAPELLLGEVVSKTDPRVDIYALGLTLLEMLAGDIPFESLSPDEALNSKMAHDFVPDSLPRWVQEVLLRATHPTPELRFQTAVELGEAISARHAPYLIDSQRIKAHQLAQKSAKKLAQKQWRAAERLANQALHFYPNSAAGLVAAGRCHLLLRRTAQARSFFSRALDINPRVHVQKELGWLNLEEGHLPLAISLLSDHLNRNESDFEACNLLLKCFFLSGRYESGAELAKTIKAECPENDCFNNNGFLCKLLNGDYSREYLESIVLNAVGNPLSAYNVTVANEQPRSWNEDGQPALRDKVLFQEYGFSNARKAIRVNRLSVRLPDGTVYDSSAPVVTLGRWDRCDVALDDNMISRRHAVIVNFPNDVWLYDLGSTCGSWVDGDLVIGRLHLDGVHKVQLGSSTLEVAARSGLLV